MHNLLAKELKKGKIGEEEMEQVKKRIGTVEGISGFGGEDGVDLAIEVTFFIPRTVDEADRGSEQAVSENLKVKQSIFQDLATHLKPSSILASNTSSISLSKLAASAISRETGEDRSRSVVGFHFCKVDISLLFFIAAVLTWERSLVNPVPIMTLVELIPALQTHPLVLKTAQTFAEEMGKTVVTSRDSPGFISNRLLMPFINESIEVLDSGIATREDIDQTMKLGKSLPLFSLIALSLIRTLRRQVCDTLWVLYNSLICELSSFIHRIVRSFAPTFLPPDHFALFPVKGSLADSMASLASGSTPVYRSCKSFTPRLAIPNIDHPYFFP